MHRRLSLGHFCSVAGRDMAHVWSSRQPSQIPSTARRLHRGGNVLQLRRGVGEPRSGTRGCEGTWSVTRRSKTSTHPRTQRQSHLRVIRDLILSQPIAMHTTHPRTALTWKRQGSAITCLQRIGHLTPGGRIAGLAPRQQIGPHSSPSVPLSSPRHHERESQNPRSGTRCIGRTHSLTSRRWRTFWHQRRKPTTRNAKRAPTTHTHETDAQTQPTTAQTTLDALMTPHQHRKLIQPQDSMDPNTPRLAMEPHSQPTPVRAPARATQAHAR